MDTEETSGGSDFKSAFGGALGNLLSDLLKSTGIPLPLAVPCVILVLLLLNSFKRKSVGILLVVVPCAIMILVLRPFFKEQMRLKKLCKEVREEREKLSGAGQCPPDTELLRNAECLRDNRLNKWVNKPLCKRMESSKTLEALLKELENACVVFGASTFLKGLEDRCQGVNNQSRPSVESDMSGEDTDPKYGEDSRKVLVQKIVKHFSDWRKSFRPNDNNLYLEWIGANDIALVSATLQGFAASFCDGRIDVYLPRCTVTDANLENLKRTFESNASVVIAENPHEGYDIVISTHFWQHHSESVAETEMLGLLMTDGLFVLLAAISRDPKANEYVCEGWAPMKAKVKDKSDLREDIYWVPFRPMGEYSERLNICYHWSKEFEDHTPVLSWGFPKSVAVDKDVVSKDKDLSEWIRKYFQWESAEGWHASVIGGVDRQPLVTVDDVQILARAQAIQAGAATDSITEYLLMELAYSVGAADAKNIDTKAREISKLPIIACVGYEENQWRPGQIGNKVPITFHPAHAVTLREGNKLLGQVLMEAGLRPVMGRYKPYIPASPCASDYNGRRVWRIHTRIYEADLNDFLVFENEDGQNGVYSYLPKRRYLTQKGYKQGLQMLDAYKAWTKELRDESSDKSSVYGDSLLRFDSVTWLWSYKQLLNFCKDRGLQIDMNDLYFHKVYCELSDNDADNKVLGEMQEECSPLFDKKCCVAKDDAFNKLPVKDRIRLLARLNVHDVLLFAQKKA